MTHASLTLTAGALPVVQSYGPAGFRISGVEYASSLLITRNQVVPLDVRQPESLTPELFTALSTRTPPLEILLIGTGTAHRPLPPALRNALKTQRLNPDVMATGAACRTLNILLSEERQVAALLLLPA